ncbi:hypothetical protein SKAU_G00189680 [Synaphobranchus kaupii]|uniref:Uncharacterized protein n=1 Tax=Synaphobranchus kaupii TaxID=118154 RepID=A0A9Q1FDE3_SYNKA|nr:hypothetical protein SKAU_G00189680 [Synaphobranchus kaupii]
METTPGQDRGHAPHIKERSEGTGFRLANRHMCAAAVRAERGPLRIRARRPRSRLSGVVPGFAVCSVPFCQSPNQKIPFPHFDQRALQRDYC